MRGARAPRESVNNGASARLVVDLAQALPVDLLLSFLLRQPSSLLPTVNKAQISRMKAVWALISLT
ncbi:hypothetical protein BV20DRAFT_136776 [Pilatotrama ljubarskyi]|nr:hypothetical protein BV20DRAFT_136776 [Pilatotrama ljubarskyi]